MKIAIVNFGHIDVILPLAKHLAANNQVDIYMAFAQTKRSESVINFKGLTVQDGFQDAPTVAQILGDDVSAYIGGSCPVNVFIFKNLKVRDVANIRLSRQLARRLIAEKYDVVHFNGNSVFQLYISMFSRAIPKVHTIHDFNPHVGKRNNIAMKLRFPEMVNRYLVRCKRQKIVHARQVKDIIEKTVPSAKNINVVYYGPLDIYTYFKTDPEKKPEESLPDHYILFFGRIAYYKGISFLIDAFNSISPSFPAVKLFIAGGGDTRFIREQLESNPHIVLLNRYIENHEMARLIRGSLLVVCPYIDASQSGVIQTAYAFGRPVLATTVGGLPEVVTVGKTGTLVPPADADALAQALTAMLEDTEILTRMSDHIHTNLEEHLQWETIARQTIAVYQKAINSNQNQQQQKT